MVVESFRKEFPEMDYISNPTLHTANIAGAVVATWNLGCLVGAMFTIFIPADRLGRKRTIILGLVLELVGTIVQTASFSLGQYVAGRFLFGVGNGLIASTVPAWQAECLKSHRRGSLLTVSFGSCVTLGLALAYWISFGFYWIQPSSASWRVPTALSTVFLLPALALITYLPESPRWLILAGCEKEALNVMSALNELPPEDENIHREFLMIKNGVVRMVNGSSFAQVFSLARDRCIQRILLASALQIMQQLTGINLFVQYLGSMFANQLQYETERSLLLAACCATAFFLASLVALFGIDMLWGRRALTMLGSSGMCVCMIVLSIANSIPTAPARYLMTAFVFLFTMIFSIGWQGMSWLWAVELVPLDVRGPANALLTAANWLSNSIVVLCTPTMFANIAHKTYVVFAVTNFVTIPLIYFFFPETGGRSLEDVDAIFQHATEAGKPWFSVVGVAKKEARRYDQHGATAEARSGSITERITDGWWDNKSEHDKSPSSSGSL